MDQVWTQPWASPRVKRTIGQLLFVFIFSSEKKFFLTKIFIRVENLRIWHTCIIGPSHSQRSNFQAGSSKFHEFSRVLRHREKKLLLFDRKNIKLIICDYFVRYWDKRRVKRIAAGMGLNPGQAIAGFVSWSSTLWVWDIIKKQMWVRDMTYCASIIIHYYGTDLQWTHISIASVSLFFTGHRADNLLEERN